MAGSPVLPTENINEVILRLLALEPNEVDELDYETYNSYLREILVEITSGKRKIDGSETEYIKSEFKRVRGKKGRFKIKKTKITADKLGLGSIRKKIKGTQKRLLIAPSGGVPRQTTDIISKKKDTETSSIVGINKTLDSILSTLTSINSENKKRSEKERRDSESKKRSERERQLELRPIEGIKKLVSAVTKPFQSIWDKVVNFITNVILGRIVLKLIDWIADPNNQGKIKTVIRFFKDNWPLLLTLYLRFGTGIGRFIGKLTGILVKGSLKLIQVTASLAARMGLKGAGRLAGFLGGPKGRLLGAGLTIGANVAGMVATSSAIEGLAGGETKVPGFSGGGWTGGVKNFFGNMFSGLVKGPKGRDKVPAMLTDGEFVMSAGAVRKYGVDTLESMNAAGGGTNVPQIVDGVTHAVGGGFIGNPVAAQEAWTNYMKMNPNKFVKGSDYGDFESVNRASRDFMKTFMKTGKPPEWARIAQRTTRVNTSPRQETYSQKPPRSSWWENFKSQYQGTRTRTQPPPPSSSPPNTSSTSLMRRPTSALSTEVGSVGKMRPRGYGGALQAAFAAMEFNDRKQAGQTTTQAGLGAAGSTLGGSVGWMAGAKAGALLGGAIGTMFGGIGAAPGAAVGAIIGGVAGGFGGASLGGKLADDVSGVNVAKERMSRGGIGGKIVGGYGLREQTFKDAPKTQIMSDDKGRPFVGYKAMRGGKPVYVRGPQPGQGTTNPFESLGRMINPGAYKDIDAQNERKKYEEASRNSVASLRARGASQATISRRQAELKKGVKPLPRSKPKPYVAAGGGMGGRRGSGSNPSRSGSKPPSMPAVHRDGTRSTRATLGIGR